MLNCIVVLCGRGRAIRSHPGNQKFLDLINKYKADYMKSKKGGKLHIVKVVVDEIRQSEGRFLQQVSKSKDQPAQSHPSGCDGITPDELEGCWVEIGDVKAMTKTSQAFRDLRPSKDTSAVSATATRVIPTKPASTILKVKNHVKEEGSSDNKASIQTKSTNYGDIIDRKKDGNSIAKMIQLHKKKQLQQQRAKLKKGGQQQQIPVLQATVESSSESESESDEDSSSDSDDDRASSSSDDDEGVKVEPTARASSVDVSANSGSHPQKEKSNPQCPSPDSTDPIDEERRLQQEKREKRLRLIALKQRTSLKSMTGKKPKALVPRKKASSLPTASDSNKKKAATATSGTTKKRKLPKGSLAAKTATAGGSSKKRKQLQEIDTPNTASTTGAGSNASGSSFSSLLAAVNKRVEEAKGQDDVSDTETEDSFPMYHESS